jgi:ferredoxin
MSSPEEVVAGLMVRIDQATCIGSGNCVVWAPDTFEIVGGLAQVKSDGHAREAILEAACNCPVRAISAEPVSA